MICSLASNGFEMPPAQKAFQTLSTCDVNSTVIMLSIYVAVADPCGAVLRGFLPGRALPSTAEKSYH